LELGLPISLQTDNGRAFPAVASTCPSKYGRLLVSSLNTRPGATWRVRKVVTYIESNLSGTILVGALARIAGVSCSCFHRTFRSCFGVTPHVYVTLKRVEFAQILMLTTNESLSQISLACGLTDQSHFTRIFRRLTGKTPGQWRTWRRRQRELRGFRDVQKIARPGLDLPSAAARSQGRPV
jgi:transcriptional regulator GlxA family with amidase domain